jgi:anthranilate synthase/indole-3-glycerol phosphate synthase/phosphoribosylanthranilate isomerase
MPSLTSLAKFPSLVFVWAWNPLSIFTVEPSGARSFVLSLAGPTQLIVALLPIHSQSYAGEIKHGKMSAIRHDGRGCLKGLPQGFKSTRYHSLSASLSTIPQDIMVTAVAEESGVIMGVRHRLYTVEAVQYHPESILSETGDDLFRNFLALKGGSWELNPQSLVLDQSLPPFPVEALSVRGPSALRNIPSILEKICAQRLKDIDIAKSTPGSTPDEVNTFLSLNLAPPITPLVPRLRAQVPALMAEIKRASPSKGPIALTTNAPQQALTYALSGAAVISVLTEPTWFKGSLLDMQLVRRAVDFLPNRPAILRKDFILDEYQIAEARIFGADTVLLIVAVLPPARLQALYAYALRLGMEPLVEVNNAREMSQALELGAKVIGINNRNLHNFDVDMNTTTRLLDMVQGHDVVLCALSGISSASDVKSYTEQGVSAVLVGEALMRAKDTPAFIRTLLGSPESKPKAPHSPLVKICGIRTRQDAVFAADAGADMLGLVFVPTSKRLVSLEDAQSISLAVRSSRLKSSPRSPPGPSETYESGSWFNFHANQLLTVPPRPLLVGVFQNQTLDTILHTVAVCQLDIVQLHGNEPLEWASLIPVPVIRAFHVGANGQGLEGIGRPGYHNFVLLDAARADGLSGGSGKILDWDLAKRFVDGGGILLQTGSEEDHGTLMTGQPLPIFLAGGLTPENVAEAIVSVSPFAVDVSGGVENSSGGKDGAKIVAFIQEVKKASTDTHSAPQHVA